MICPACKKEVPDKSNFCINCGCSVNSHLTTIPVISKEPVKTPKKSFRVLFFIACGLITALVLFMLIFMIASGSILKEYEQEIEQYEKQVSDLDKELKAKAKSTMDEVVIIPGDESYIYHRYECENYDHSIFCYVTDKKTAEENGCKPCQYCIKD